MKRGFYLKLAATNVRKNGKIYTPYLLMCTFITAMYFMILSLSINDGLSRMRGGSSVQQLLSIGVGIVGFFSVLFIFYINSFLMKRRKKEFGLYTILGMEKKHLVHVVFWENFYVSALSLVFGLLLGVVFNKLCFLLLLRMFDAKVPLGFSISAPALYRTLLLFIAMHFVVFCYCAFSVISVSPIELLHGGNTGEREPKAKWLLAILGVLTLAGGYYLAVTTKSPIAAMLALAAAIVLVMIGTYLLFTAGSIAFLKLLKKKKNFYYKTKHFIPVSGMLYRMKQNAFGLANIAIMATGVLIMISTSLSIILDVENIVGTNFPKDVNVSTSSYTAQLDQKMQTAIKTTSKSSGIAVDDNYHYSYLAIAALQEGDTFRVDIRDMSDNKLMSANNLTEVTMLPLDDYNRIMDSNEKLSSDEVLMYTSGKPYKGNTVQLGSQAYRITKHLKKLFRDRATASGTYDNYVLVVKDIDQMTAMQKEISGDSDRGITALQTFYGIDMKAEGKAAAEKDASAFKKVLQTNLSSVLGESDLRVDTRQEGHTNFLAAYTGIIFIGIFLSIIFIVATVLIIYYKQITEGYDDKERFDIMMKVGLDRREVKQSINSQIRIVFFLPLVTAAIHTLFAFPIIERLMMMLNLTNKTLYLFVTLGCFVGFALLYTLVYRLTAKAYLAIVAQKTE